MQAVAQTTRREGSIREGVGATTRQRDGTPHSQPAPVHLASGLCGRAVGAGREACKELAPPREPLSRREADAVRAATSAARRPQQAGCAHTNSAARGAIATPRTPPPAAWLLRAAPQRLQPVVLSAGSCSRPLPPAHPSKRPGNGCLQRPRLHAMPCAAARPAPAAAQPCSYPHRRLADQRAPPAPRPPAGCGHR